MRLRGRLARVEGGADPLEVGFAELELGGSGGLSAVFCCRFREETVSRVHLPEELARRFRPRRLEACSAGLLLERTHLLKRPGGLGSVRGELADRRLGFSRVRVYVHELLAGRGHPNERGLGSPGTSFASSLRLLRSRPLSRASLRLSRSPRRFGRVAIRRRRRGGCP